MIKTPKLRFPEFTDEWKAQKLGKLLNFKNGINGSKEQYGTGVKFVNVLDILNNSFITYEKISGSIDIDEKTLEKNAVEYGDVLFQRSSETREEVGLANVYLDKERKATFGGFVIRGKKIGEYDPSFLNKFLKTTLARKEISTRAGGSTRYNVGQEVLSEVKLLFPTLTEQEKIGSFFSLIDQQIEKQQEKIDNLLLYKKGIIQKIFSKKVRFTSSKAGDSFPDWEKKTLTDVLKERKTYSTKNNEFEHVTLSKDGIYIKNERYDRDFLVKTVDKKYKITRLNDICYNPANLKFGVICRNTYGDAIFSPIYVTFEVSQEFNPAYLEYYLTRNDFINKVRKYEEGTVYERMAVKPEDFLLYSDYFPCKNEQDKIANYLNALTSKINLEKLKLDKMKNFRQGLIQKMYT